MSAVESAMRPGAEGPGRQSRDLVAGSQRLRAEITAALGAPGARRGSARSAFEALRQDVVRRHLATMPLSRIRETTQGRLRLGPIEAAGYRTVGVAARAGRGRLEAIPGVGPHTASQVIAAARQLEAAMLQDAKIRFDPDTRHALETSLLGELYQYDVAKRAVLPQAGSLNALAADLDEVIADAARASSRLRMFFSGRDRKQSARAALAGLGVLMSSPETAARRSQLDAALRGRLISLCPD